MKLRAFILGLFFFAILVPVSVLQAQQDQDGDAILDGNDHCPTYYDDKSPDGCPPGDWDNDAVDNSADVCPDVTGDPRNGGCPAAAPPAEQQPPPAQGSQDLDGDGIPGVGNPGDPDACPFESGRGDQFGGRNGANGCPVDSDADGTVDGLDQCPFVAGGVPPCAAAPTTNATVAPAVVATRPAASTAAPSVQRAALPTSGACVLATAGTDTVNVRQEPNANAAIVNRLTPDDILPVLNVTEIDGETWYQVQGGWVAERVARLGGDCSTLGQAQPPASNFDLTEVLADCPELLRDAQQLPVHLQLDVSYPRTVAPCDYLQTLLTDLLFPVEPEQLAQANTDAILADCPQFMPALVGFMARYQSVAANGWSILNGVMTPTAGASLTG